MRMLIPTTINRRLASDLFQEMDRFFDAWNTAAPSGVYDERSYHPSWDITETDEHFLLSVDLPGMKKEDVKIEITDQLLTISGERKRHGFFKRSFSLSSSVDSTKVEANYENGVLELYIPKTNAAKPRQVEIQTGKSGFFENLLGSKKADLKDVS